jgi:hypothetical protein
MRRLPLLAPLLVAALLATGCGSTSDDTTTSPTVSTELTGSPGPDSSTGTPASARPSAVPSAARSSAAAASWPSPEDCVSYNPANVTVFYEAGIHEVRDGNKIIMRLPGGPGEIVGQQGVALAQRYKRHCYLGRANTREDHNQYVFDYWRDLSGRSTTIPDEDEVCSSYDRTNLTVENMGGGHGWRVKDHDHVLHLFDTESDARGGKLVLARYQRICMLGNSGDDDPDQVSFSL